jgi:hypothetical protein
MPDGANEPEFQAAIDIWLSDNDETSLPMLARQAQDGNRAAQIQLGQIEQHEVSPSRWIATLSRDERRALFRAPVGKFGKSWLAIAAEHSELARALYAARDFEQIQTVIPDLFALGEFRAMDPVISRLVSHGEWETLVALGLNGMLPPEHRHAAWRGALRTLDAIDAQAERFMRDSIATIGETDPELAALLALGLEILAAPDLTLHEKAAQLERWQSETMHFENSSDFTGDVTGWLTQSDPSKQIIAACSTLCPAQPERCAKTAGWRMLGIRRTDRRIGSPVATLIPPARYVKSQRAIGEFLRRIRSSLRSHVSADHFIQSVAGGSQCLAHHVKAAMARRWPGGDQ